MADSSVTFQTTTLATPPGSTVVSTRTNLSSEHMQVVMQGIDGSDSVVPSTAANGLTVDVTRVQGTVAVSGPLTDTQLRASSVPVDTELPAAAALADATANPTTPSAGVLNLLFNGTTWDRARGDITNGLDVDVTRLPALAAGANAIGSVNVTQVPTVASTTVTQVASSATSVTLKASNTARKGLLIFNDSTAALFVKFGATASATSFTVKIAAGGYYEMQPGVVYTGVVDGIWSAANGNAYVTEL